MGRSNYPDKYDTSVNIPQVRGNINEIGIDLLNSIRSAILQIEHTLGINPQGSATNTVSDRLSKSLDLNGDIKKEAFDKAGVIYGPITNESVSKVAAIEETKLKLDFPTRLLQTELSLVSSKIDEIIDQFNEISSKLSSHLFLDAPNRHTSNSISVAEIVGSTSDVALSDISSGSVQSTLDSILNKHIRYSGLNISGENNSHSANQIYFNKASTSEYINSDNMQGAIEELAILAAGQETSHQNIFHGNGYLNISNLSILSSVTEIDSDLQVSFIKSTYLDSTRKSEITLLTPKLIPLVQVSDILEIQLLDSIERYIISNIIYNSSNEVEKIIIFGSLPENSTSGSTISLYKREKLETNDWGLCTTVLEYPSLLSAGIVQIANPNSPGVVSVGFTSNSISAGSTFNLDIDGKEYIVSCYNLTYTFQTIESIISRINESLLEQGAGALAYKVYSKKTSQYEIAIVSNFYGEDKYIKISSSTDSLENLGLSSYNNEIIYGNSGNNFVINGTIYSNIKNIMNISGLVLDSGSNSISGIDFSAYNIKEKDIINISGTDQDNGSYFITNVTPSQIFVEATQLPGGVWSSNSSSTSKFEVLNNTISFENYSFIKTGASPNGSLFELILDQNSNFTYRTKLEYGMFFRTGRSLYSVVDAIQYNTDLTQTLTFEIYEGDLYCYLDSLDKKKITNYKNSYLDIYSKEHNVYIKIIIYDASLIIDYINALGSSTSFSTNLYFYQKPEYSNIIRLCNINYSSANSRIDGSTFRLPYIYDLKDSGTIKTKDISNEVKKDLQIIPMKETRNSGVVSGLEILNTSFSGDSNYLVTISAGVAYISGKRFHFDGKVDFNTGISSLFDKIIIFINNEGIIFADYADSLTCNFYINSSDNIILGTIEYNSSETQIIDQRLIISDIDLKLLNSITVSPVSGMGHFRSINSAIKYAKRFQNLYPDAGIPEIVLKAGIHKVEVNIPLNFASTTNASLIKYYDKQGLYIDFPVKIVGEGDSTVLDFITGYNDFPISSDDRSSISNNKGFIIINGAGSTDDPDYSIDRFNDGNITLSNFKIKNSTILYISPKVINTSSYDINFHKVKVNNIYFDWSNLLFDTPTFALTYYFQKASAIKIVSNTGSSSDYMGGIDIDSCTFDTCYIDLSESIQLFNVSIRNNYFYSQDKKINSAANSFLIKFANDTTAVFNKKNIDIISNFSAASSSLDNYDSYLFSDTSGTLSESPNTSYIRNLNSKDITTAGTVTFEDGGFSGLLNVDIESNFNNQANFNNNVNIGNNFTDSLVVSASIESNLIPRNSNTYNIGSSILLWNNLYVNRGIFIEIGSDLLPSSTYDIGSSSSRWSNIYCDNINSVASKFLINITTGSSMIGEDSIPNSKLHIKQIEDNPTLSGDLFGYTSGPGIRLESTGSSYWDIFYYEGAGSNYLYFAHNNERIAYINSTLMYTGSLNFTGQHRCSVDGSRNIDDYKHLVGLIVVSTGKYYNTISEKNNPTINESLPKVILSSKQKQKSVFGVISDAEDLNKNTREYAVGAFVSVSKKETTSEDTRVIVNSVGEGGIWIINQNGNLENGDYITTSDIDGYGMRQDDDILRNYTVAKITQDCNFDKNIFNTRELNINGITYIAAFVGCTYHCG